jgi:hypothetical protein
MSVNDQYEQPNLLKEMIETACVKCMCIPGKDFGRCCAVGCARIGALPKSNSRSIWGASSSCTTSASEATRCVLRSLSYWSRKTLESNMSEGKFKNDHNLNRMFEHEFCSNFNGKSIVVERTGSVMRLTGSLGCRRKVVQRGAGGIGYGRGAGR